MYQYKIKITKDLNVYFKKEDAKIYNKIISHLGNVNLTTILKFSKNMEKLEISNIFYMGTQNHTTSLEKKNSFFWS